MNAFDYGNVRRCPIERVEFVGREPARVRVFPQNELRLRVCGNAQKCVQDDGEIRVFVFDGDEFSFCDDGKIHFFAHFANECGFGRFARFDFPAGKFPFVRGFRIFRVPAFRAENFSVVSHDDCRRYTDFLFHEKKIARTAFPREFFLSRKFSRKARAAGAHYAT